MNLKSITCRCKLLLCVFPCLIPTWSQATGYKVAEITNEEVLTTSYAIFAGNKYLNNSGQVTGVSRKYTQNKLFNNGNRVFTWQRNRLRTLATLGTDAIGYGDSVPSGLNKDGQVAGTSRYFDKNGIDQGQRAVYWDDGDIVNLGKEAEKLGFVTSTGATINARGQVAGTGLLYGNGQDKGTRPILWTQGRAKNLGALAVYDGYNEHIVTGMNAAGHVIGWDGDLQSFFWANNTLQRLPPLNLDIPFSIANAINNKDQVVGSSQDVNGLFSVLWTSGFIQNLGSLDPNPGPDAFPFGEAIAINERGQVIGYEFLPVGQHAYLWTDGKLTDLGVLGIDQSGAESSFANAINNKGQVVGFSSYSENGSPNGNHAFIYQNNTMIDLNTLLPFASGWLLENALAINDGGQIAVYGTYTQGTLTYKGYALLTPM